MNSRLKHKRGDTFVANVVYRNAETQVAIDVTNITIKSQIRNLKGVLISELSINKTEPLIGKFTLTDTETQDWPFNQVLIWDIQYTANDDKISTETIEIYVQLDVTE